MPLHASSRIMSDHDDCRQYSLDAQVRVSTKSVVHEALHGGRRSLDQFGCRCAAGLLLTGCCA